MARFAIFPLIAVGIGLGAAEGPVIMGSGYALPAPPIYVAPGQLLTLVVGGMASPFGETVRVPGGRDMPTDLAGFSVTFWQGRPIGLAPILEVRRFSTCGNPNAPGCGRLAVITIQVPFEVQPGCPACPDAVVPPVVLTVLENGVGSVADASPLADQIHILTTCDILTNLATTRPFNATGLPCSPVVTHADGSLLSPRNPAQPGEVVVAYAVGLGRTTPAQRTGQVVSSPAPTETQFTLDFNYRPNSLPTKPAPGDVASRPLFTGATPGFVGLYQINFTVPPPPPGTPACEEPSPFLPAANVVRSNLTVSVGGGFSFDGAGICVAVN